MIELNDFEKKCQDWLDTPVAERSLEEGAMLMLKANRNKILYQNAISKKMFDKIAYELKKYLGSKFRQCDAVTVEKLTEEVELVTTKIYFADAETKGKRKDHDELPQEVQDIIHVNSQRYARLRGLHERVKVLSGTGYTPCDRFPYLKEMLQLSTEIRDAWKFYDEYKIGDKLNIKAESVKPIDAQRIGSNRVYIGRAIKEVPEKLKEGKLAAGSNQIAEAQIRYNELMMAGQEVKPETIEGLKAIGVIVQVTETKPEGGENGEKMKDPENPDIEPAQYDNPDAPSYVAQADGTVRYPMTDGIPFDFLPAEGTIVAGTATLADGSKIEPGKYTTAEGLTIEVLPEGIANIIEAEEITEETNGTDSLNA